MPRSGPGPIRDDGERWDVLADVHGCIDELTRLLAVLGWEPPALGSATWRPPAGRRLAVAGDLVDRGPATPAVLRLIMPLVEKGSAVVTVGNHEDKLQRALIGRPVRVAHGLETSLEQLDHETAAFRSEVEEFLRRLPSHAILDRGRLLVAHAGLPERHHGDPSARARELAMYGPTVAGVDRWGLPLRIDWAADYAGRAVMVYGHTPIVQPTWRNRTIDIDTGCVFGGALTAVRYPEQEVVSVAARETYQPKASPYRRAHPGGEPVAAAAAATHLQAPTRDAVASTIPDAPFDDRAAGDVDASAA